MRGWLMVLLVVLVVAAAGGGFYLLFGSDGGQIALPTEGQADQPPATLADPLPGGRHEVPGSDHPAASGGTGPTAGPRRVAVTLIAVDAGSSQALPGFEFELTATGRPTRRVVEDSAQHRLDLAVGSYVVRASRSGCEPPGASEFTITETSQPLTIELPFTPFEAVLELTVTDQARRQAIAQYRATVQTFDDDAKPGRTEFLPRRSDQPLVLPGKIGQRLVVRIEAEGYVPAAPVEVRFAPGQRKIEKQVLLAAQMKFAGIELRVTDAAQQAIQRLNVVAHRATVGRQPRRLWDRTRENAAGHYRLPDLAPGRYQLEVSSVDRDHLPTLHLSRTITLEYFDGQHIIKPVTLPDGAMLELRTTNPSGQRIGKEVWIEVTHPDGEVREVIWRPLLDGKPDGHIGLGADRLTADAPARLFRCLPGGRYQLKLRWGQGEIVERLVDLRAGQLAQLEVQLSR